MALDNTKEPKIIKLIKYTKFHNYYNMYVFIIKNLYLSL